MATSSSIVQSRAGKYVAFQISRRYFVVEAHRVRTVVPASTVEPVDSGLDFVQGTVKVNGREYPVVDVRNRLGAGTSRPRPRGSILVLEVGEGPRACIGLVADKLTEVIDIRERDIRGNAVQLRSNGKPYGRPKVFLNLERLVSEQELATLQTFGNGS